ncbi:GGDEF domain-containing protein [Sphingomonas sp. LaA6.9]|uniref:GGDEF domain-containing protein n=1 Tax=Sphingomonas sp. LaA6.9 TaxID=2919914 RepID=UPI001F4FAC85|nr:GGDEF domain-containing protein [Sphingomonas sp. LaA6.9]MCJ8157750.1 diguanylate cyclase [Sphingomonas sp. LaA6.9]
MAQQGRLTVPADRELLRKFVGVGAWECDLRDDSLTWTTSIFDLFGLPRDTGVDRADAVARYCDESREAMELLRAYAIKHRRGFTMDARLISPDGEPRWMRLATAVECEERRPSRLYGTKQDITLERTRRERLRGMAGVDECTGFATRAAFDAHFFNGRAGERSLSEALVIINVEDIARIEKRFGPAASEACLGSLASRLAFLVKDASMIARVGEHDFAVLLHASSGSGALERTVHRLVRALAEPVYWQGYLLSVTPAAGIEYAGDAARRDAAGFYSVALERAKGARRKRDAEALPSSFTSLL